MVPMAASKGRSGNLAGFSQVQAAGFWRPAAGTHSARKLIPTAAIAILLSLLAGALSTIVIKDLTGRTDDWLFWTVTGLSFVIWIVEERRLRS